MQIDLHSIFDADKLPLAERAIEARAKRLGVSSDVLLGCLLRPYLRDIAYDETGRPDELTPLNVQEAERRADLVDQARRDAEAARLAETQATESTTEESQA